MLRFVLFGIFLFSSIIHTENAFYINGLSTDDAINQFVNKVKENIPKDFLNELNEIINNEYIIKTWEQFKKDYGKIFAEFQEEKQDLGNFLSNLKNIMLSIIGSDQGLKSSKLQINPFADMNVNEFLRQNFNLTSDGIGNMSLNDFINRIGTEHINLSLPNLTENKDNNTQRIHNLTNESVSSTHKRQTVVRSETDDKSDDGVDYRQYMNPAQNVGPCGSSYAFAAVAVIEGTYALQKGKQFKLSEQELVDCSSNMGCNGGSVSAAFDYVKENGGLQTAESYPSTEKQGKCITSEEKFGAISDYEKLEERDEEAMLKALTDHGPLAVGIHAQAGFQYYNPKQNTEKYDIIDISSCPTEVNQAVVIVGYGTEDGKDYWIVENFWGTEWGLNGYFKIARNKNMCGIATYVHYVKL